MPGHDGNVSRSFEIGGGNRHCEADSLTALNGAMDRLDVEQITNYDLRSEGAQAQGALILASHMGPYSTSSSEKEVSHLASDRSNSPRCTGDQNRTVE